MIFLLDNYDSFTYNLFQALSELGAEVAHPPDRSKTVYSDRLLGARFHRQR